METHTTIAPEAQQTKTPVQQMLPELWRRRIACNEAESKEETDRLANAQCEFERDIIETPAENFTDLLIKWDLATAWGDEPLLSDYAVEAISSDLYRLAGATSSPTFDPEAWLSHFKCVGGNVVKLGDGFILGGPPDHGWFRLLNRMRPADRNRLSAHIAGEC